MQNNRLSHEILASKFSHGTGRIVEPHLGKIWGKNKVDGIGATFSFSLPIDIER